MTPVTRKQLPADVLVQPTRSGPGPGSQPLNDTLPSSSASWSQLAPQEHLMTPVTKKQLPADALVQPTHAMPSSSPHKFSPKAKAWFPQDRLTQPSPHTGPSPGLSYQQPSHMYTQHYHQPSHQHLANLISSLLYVLHSPQSCASPSYSSHSYTSPACTQVAQPVTSSWGHDWAPDSYYHSEYAY